MIVEADGFLVQDTMDFFNFLDLDRRGINDHLLKNLPLELGDFPDGVLVVGLECLGRNLDVFAPFLHLL